MTCIYQQYTTPQVVKRSWLSTLHSLRRVALYSTMILITSLIVLAYNQLIYFILVNCILLLIALIAYIKLGSMYNCNTRQLCYIVQDGCFLVFNVSKFKQELYRTSVENIVEFGTYDNFYESPMCNIKDFATNTIDKVYYISFEYLGSRTILLCQLDQHMYSIISKLYHNRCTL